MDKNSSLPGAAISQSTSFQKGTSLKLNNHTDTEFVSGGLRLSGSGPKNFFLVFASMSDSKAMMKPRSVEI